MASICQLSGKWRALIRRKGHKQISKYFDTKREAEQWARKVESEIDSGQTALQSDTATVTDLIKAFNKMRNDYGRPVLPETNTFYMLLHLDQDIGSERIIDLTPERLAQWAMARQEQGAGGYTVNMELSQLSTVIRHTASTLKLILPDVIGGARPHLHYLQLITGGRRRARVATDDELSRLLAHIRALDPVVADAIEVSSITGLRRSELIRITWADLDVKNKTVLVRQRKHPRRTEAHDDVVPLFGRAWEIVARQPKTGPQIFRTTKEKLTDHVTAATRALGIPDLHLHDMRRNANSRLRELGFDQHERKAIMGHKSDEAHDIYIAIRTEQLHEKYSTAVQGKPPSRKRRKKDPDHQP